MELYRGNQLGIDILCELSVGWYVTDLLDSSGFYIQYRPDGTTPVNVINGFAWIDDLERKDVVKREDYTDYRHQIPLPIVSYDFLNDTANVIQLGSNTKTKTYTLSFVIGAENKAQAVNLAGFVSHLLEEKEIPIYNYNKELPLVGGFPKIGVIHCEDILTTRLFDVFVETNLAKNFSLTVSCDAIAEFDNNFER
jgi:hypothetical protein